MAISTIVLDTYKQKIGAADAFNLSDSFNGRVGDEQVPLEVRFLERGLPHKFDDNLVPYLSGFVGDMDENDRVTAATGTAVSYQGSRDDVVGLGQVKLNLPGTMFPQEGFFYGFLGLETPDHSHRESTFSVWFHVYNGNPDMYVNEAPFRTELQKLLDESQALYDDADADLKKKLSDWQQQVTDLLTEQNKNYAVVQATVDNLTALLARIKEDITAQDVITGGNIADYLDDYASSRFVTIDDGASFYLVASTFTEPPRFKAWGYYNAAGLVQSGTGYYGTPEEFDLTIKVNVKGGWATMTPRFVKSELYDCMPDFDIDNPILYHSSTGEWIYLVSGKATIGIQCLNGKFK